MAVEVAGATGVAFFWVASKTFSVSGLGEIAAVFALWGDSKVGVAGSVVC